jgi:hypothetical protein
MESEKYLRRYSPGGGGQLFLDAAGFTAELPLLEFVLNNLGPAKVHARCRPYFVTMSSPGFPI